MHRFVLHGFFFARISERFVARIFCTKCLHEFLHGFLARLFFLHGFMLCFCADFLQGFLARIFGGVPNPLLGSTKISLRKTPN